MRRTSALLVTTLLATPSVLLAQRPETLSQQTREYVSVDADIIALTNVRVIDGTGTPARANQTIVIDGGRITAVGNTSDVTVPATAQVLDLTGHTVIPGMVGLHNHLYYTAAGGRGAQLTYSAPRLYLGAGVTTVRTTGSRAPYAEINLKNVIDMGRSPGPRIHITAPYITGGRGINTTMTLLNTPEEARRFVAYWVEEGATWLKAYANVGRAELSAAIDEAHEHGIKVTGHLCSVSFTEAVAMGIDNLEHGLLTNTDYHPDKQPDQCPRNNSVVAGGIDVSSPAVQATFATMIENDVPMTSTLSVYELFVPNRPTRDPRALEAMAPEVRTDYLAARDRIDLEGQTSFTLDMLTNAMAYERAFVEAGGVLAAGVDPTGNGGALPGFGDQRNYELLIEAGFTPEQVVQIVSANGARILGVYDELGSIEPGKIADLVVVDGDLTADASAIKRVTTVFKDGVGFDSAKLIAAVKGRVGIN